jgi:hypothetical protein
VIPVAVEVMEAANRTHQPLWRVRMLSSTGTQIGEDLPFTGGTITKTMSVTPRTRATLEVPTQMVPTLIDQNYLPTGQRLVFEYRIDGVGGWVTVADLDMVSSQITRPDSVWVLEAVDRSIRVALDDTARGGWVEPTGTIDSAIRYIVNRTFPGSVFEVSGLAGTMTVPAGTVTDGDPWSAAVGLATLAQSEVFHRANDRVWVVRFHPAMMWPADPVDSLGVGRQITQYTLTHEAGYSVVALRYRAKDGGAILATGTWVDARTDSPTSIQRIGRVVYRETRDADAAPTQSEASSAASALGARVAGRARSPSIRHVARPWLEPGDTIDVTYSGGPTERQLIDSVDIPLDTSNIQTTVCRTNQYKIGPVI